MKRRNFIIYTGLAGVGVSLTTTNHAASLPTEKGFLVEEERKVPVKGDLYDVVVCGAGPAGVIAAIEAARNGAHTMLIEVQGSLGGVWTSGLVCWILDQKKKEGVLREIIKELRNRKAACQIPTGSSISYEVEAMKLLLEEFCLDAGVDICLHTRIVGTVKNKKDRLTHVITESKSGREAWKSKIFIDTTGDGDMAALAGCKSDYGDPKNNFATQPLSLMSIIGGVKFDEIRDFTRWKGDKGLKSKKRVLKLIQDGGYNPSLKGVGIIPVRNDLFVIGANHQYGYDGINADHVSKATLNARKEIHNVVNAIKNNGGVRKDIFVVSTAEQIGIREGRRIHGLYKVTVQDVTEGRRHEDAVCQCTFPIDVHALSKEHEDKSFNYRGSLKTKAYDIPLRSLIAKDVGGLMMAGRCISGDFLAHASYRVTGNAAAMGEAAGKVAARAALKKCLPQEIDWTKLQ